MKRVYLLGAGASRDLEFTFTTRDVEPKRRRTVRLCKHGPLSSGYFYDVHKLAHSIKGALPIAARLTIPNNLGRYICEYYKTTCDASITNQDILNDERISRKINIEALYLHLEKEIRKLEGKSKDSQHLRANDPLIRAMSVRHDLLEYIHRSLSLMCYYCFSTHHRILAEYIVNHGGNVVSFNWDILLDEAMRHTGKWNYEDGYGVRFRDVIQKGKRRKRTALPQEASNNLILKPHGSINWYRKVRGNDDLFLFVPVERKTRGGTLDILGAFECDEDKNQYSTSIVPPGLKRKALPNVWVQVKEVLERAREIIAVGFAFNNNDRYVRREFEGMSFHKDLKILIVNPEADRIVGTYENVFGTDNIVKTDNTIGDYCQSIQRARPR